MKNTKSLFYGNKNNENDNDDENDVNGQPLGWRSLCGGEQAERHNHS